MYGILVNNDDNPEPTDLGFTIDVKIKHVDGERGAHKRLALLSPDAEDEIMQYNRLTNVNGSYPDLIDEDTPIDDSIDIDFSEPEQPNIAFTNTFSVDGDLLELSDANKEEFTKSILHHYLAGQASLLAGNETAIAYAEATMRDHFGVDVSIDDSLSPVLEDLFILDQTNKSLGFLNLPEEVSGLYLTKLAETLATSAPSKIKSTKAALQNKSLIRRHRQELDNAALDRKHTRGAIRKGRD